jgi:hypothetical protein
MSQAVCRPAVSGSVSGSPCEICGAQSGIGTGFSPVGVMARVLRTRAAFTSRTSG